jgi:hypothetical protein
VVVVVDPPLPLRIINAATAAMMIITTTMPAIKSVDEDPDDEVELVVLTTVDPGLDAVTVGVEDVEVVGVTLEEATLEVVDTTALDELLVVGGRVVVDVFADVVDEEEPTNEALSSDCIFKEPQ